MRLHLGLEDRVEDEGDGDNGEEANVEVEALPPGGVDVECKCTTDKGTARDAELPKAYNGSPNGRSLVQGDQAGHDAYYAGEEGRSADAGNGARHDRYV
jgi:hypothetical protein